MKKKHILFEPTEKELQELIEWSDKEILEWMLFQSECQERLKEINTPQKKTSGKMDNVAMNKGNKSFPQI